MTLHTLLHYFGAGFCLALAVFALVRDRRSFVHWIFPIGMAILAAESVFTALAARAVSPGHALVYQQLRMLAAAVLPGTWLIFSLSFTQANHRSVLGRWKWVIVAFFSLHLIFAGLFRGPFFIAPPEFLTHKRLFELGWPGYAFHVCFLLSLVLIMTVFEKTLRASRGRIRWKVKFLVLGMGGYVAVRIFQTSHTLVFHRLNPELDLLGGVALVAANLLVLISIFRAGTLQTNIYFSQKILFNSLTIMIVGVFFLALGLSTKILTDHLPFPIRAVLIFVALIGLLMALLSDRLRLKTKQLVSRHLKRPQYDYRNAWMTLTSRTATLVEEQTLCNAVVKMISEMFDTLSVSIWIMDDNRKKPRCGGSTAFSETDASGPPLLEKTTGDIRKLFSQYRNSVDIEALAPPDRFDIQQSSIDLFRQTRIRWMIPLRTGEDILGFMSLGDRVGHRPLTVEELDMLTVMAHHVAGGLLNLKLSERLRQAKEMEAFQTVAAFFVHDLKNLASGLSLMFRNLPKHFDNPEFRQDALRLMSQSVDHINTISSRLSSLRENQDIRAVETDINTLAGETLAGFGSLPTGTIDATFQDIPKVPADPEQIRKVLTNLIQNASEAVGDNGEIRVTTGAHNGWVALSVSDNGCGMSNEYMDQWLFKPFKTTKKKGTGIGLFQSKMIVEAHNGLIEVESKEGKGSTFRVLLPLKNNND